jgi:hypothetical protein
VGGTALIQTPPMQISPALLKQIEDQRLSSTEVGAQMQATVQAIAAQLGLSLRASPPWPTTCCGRGCGTCVWEAYYYALDWWREDALEAVRAAGFGVASSPIAP